MTLRLVPVTLTEANEFVAGWHRHNQPVLGHKFSVGVANSDDILVGVAIVGRPIARHYDNGQTLEVTRTCTDGTPNANSMLYGACARVAFGLGYTRLITYTQENESGGSLRGAGWKEIATRLPNKGWDRPSRPRNDKHKIGIERTLWEAT